MRYHVIQIISIQKLKPNVDIFLSAQVSRFRPNGFCHHKDSNTCENLTICLDVVSNYHDIYIVIIDEKQF